MSEPVHQFTIPAKTPFIGGFSIPLDRRAVAWLGKVAVVLGAAWGGVQLWVSYRADLLNAKVIPVAQLADLEETQRHFGEAPAAQFTFYDDHRGFLKERFFESDECVFSHRMKAGKAITRWVPDPTRSAVDTPRIALVVRPWRTPDPGGGLGLVAAVGRERLALEHRRHG